MLAATLVPRRKPNNIAPAGRRRNSGAPRHLGFRRGGLLETSECRAKRRISDLCIRFDLPASAIGEVAGPKRREPAAEARLKRPGKTTKGRPHMQAALSPPALLLPYWIRYRGSFWCTLARTGFFWGAIRPARRFKKKGAHIRGGRPQIRFLDSKWRKNLASLSAAPIY